MSRCVAASYTGYVIVNGYDQGNYDQELAFGEGYYSLKDDIVSMYPKDNYTPYKHPNLSCISGSSPMSFTLEVQGVNMYFELMKVFITSTQSSLQLYKVSKVNSSSAIIKH